MDTIFKSLVSVAAGIYILKFLVAWLGVWTLVLLGVYMLLSLFGKTGGELVKK